MAGTDTDPVPVFRRWLEEAKAKSVLADAMVLATATREGRVSARSVILRRFDEAGFVFCTDRDSRKARELTANPLAALVFVWPEIQRQVRVEGEASALSDEESDRYFADMPREFRLTVWASRQDQAVADREDLEQRMEEAARRFPDEVPRPPWWGSYRLAPAVMEFWAAAAALHDRIEYRREPQGHWSSRRLSP